MFHVRFKIKYHRSIFEKYRLFNIAEQISKAQNKEEKYLFKDERSHTKYFQYIKSTTIPIFLIFRGALIRQGRLFRKRL